MKSQVRRSDELLSLNTSALTRALARQCCLMTPWCAELCSRPSMIGWRWPMWRVGCLCSRRRWKRKMIRALTVGAVGYEPSWIRKHWLNTRGWLRGSICSIDCRIRGLSPLCQSRQVSCSLAPTFASALMTSTKQWHYEVAFRRPGEQLSRASVSLTVSSLVRSDSYWFASSSPNKEAICHVNKADCEDKRGDII